MCAKSRPRKSLAPEPTYIYKHLDSTQLLRASTFPGKQTTIAERSAPHLPFSQRRAPPLDMSTIERRGHPLAAQESHRRTRPVGEYCRIRDQGHQKATKPTILFVDLGFEALAISHCIRQRRHDTDTRSRPDIFSHDHGIETF